MMTGIASSNYSSYASTAKLTTVQSIPTANAKAFDPTALDARKPDQSACAQRMIDSLAQVYVGRQGGLDGYANVLQHQQAVVQNISSAIQRLPQDATPRQRDAWNAYLAGATSDVAYSQSEISRVRSLLDNDPAIEQTLGFVSQMLGVSSEEAHKLYQDRIDTMTASNAAAAAASAESSPVPAEVGFGAYGPDAEWGMAGFSVRAEIKLNGVVVGRVYDNGVTEIKNEYASLCNQVSFGGPDEANLRGPDVADYRIAKLGNALKASNVEIARLSTVTLAAWLANQSSGSGRVDRSA